MKSFAALKNDGSVVTWGDFSYGGYAYSADSQLASGVKQIFSTDGAFAALKDDILLLPGDTLVLEEIVVA